jgi:transmembrane sensor
MLSDLDKIKELARKYLDGQASPDEVQFLHEWYDTVSPDELEMVLLTEEKTVDEYGREILAELQKIIGKEKDPETRVVPFARRRISWRKLTTAAAILVLMIAGVYQYYQFRQNDGLQAGVRHFGGDVPAPRLNKSVLILGDGSKIYLDSVANGELITQGNVQISKLADGQLAYNPVGREDGPPSINTLTVPYGSRPIMLNLSDGSSVWLDAGSSISYPTVFTGKERKVEMSGQTYFEVAPDKSRPFVVSRGEFSVKVLGTHFNINSYEDEGQSQITLLEGAVQVVNNSGTALLKPGQQARIGDKGEIRLETDVDLEEVMAWKNERYELGGNTIDQIMRQIARWYDVEVEFSGPMPTENFMGGVPRTENVSALLKILEQTQVVTFRVEGRKIIVSKRIQ